MSLRFPLDDARTVLTRHGLSGWLLYDFQGINPIATDAIGAAGRHLTRRWFYFIPRVGTPTLLVHAIEEGNLPHLPGHRIAYSSRQELQDSLGRILQGSISIAMEYFPNGVIPYLSRVDAGTVEWVRSYGVDVVSSSTLVTELIATWTEAQRVSHEAAVAALMRIKDDAFAWVGERLRTGLSFTEFDVQSRMMERFAAEKLVTDHPPIVAIGAHAGDPHYAPDANRAATITPNHVLLIDLWARFDTADAVYGDLTWMAWIGPNEIPSRIEDAFRAVLDGRDAALSLVRQRVADKRPIAGWEADRAARDLITERGFGAFFTHRTGHNLGARSAHGDGPHLDDLETHDERLLIPLLGFTIEPGAYLPEEGFGIRSEIDVYMDADEGPVVYGGMQHEWIIIDPGTHD